MGGLGPSTKPWHVPLSSGRLENQTVISFGRDVRATVIGGIVHDVNLTLFCKGDILAKVVFLTRSCELNDTFFINLLFGHFFGGRRIGTWADMS